MIGVRLARFVSIGSAAAIVASCMSMSGTAPRSTTAQPFQWDDRPASAEDLYQKRVVQLEESFGRIDYDIKGPVPGSASPKSLPRSETTRIKQSAIEVARNYAARMNSSSLLIWDGSAIVAEEYFGATTAETLMPSKSLSKPMAAISIGRAIALGQIADLDQSVADFIEEWRGTDRQSMTVRDVLLMQTGLLEQSFDLDPAGPLMRAYIDPYHEQYIIEKYPLTDEPGTRYAYSNATGDLVAIIIERATGKPYAEFLGEDVLSPINAAGGEAWLNRPNGKSHSGCCMFFAAETYLKVAQLLLDEGLADGEQILPIGYVAEMRKPSNFNQHYGLGVWLGTPFLKDRGFLGPESAVPGIFHSEPYLADDVYLFDGSGSQVIYIVPSANVIVMRTGNNPTGEEKWDNSFLINTILGGID